MMIKFSEDTNKLLYRYNRYLEAWNPLESGDKERVKSAMQLAAEAHEGDFRKSGEPYLAHPLEVARIVAREMELDATSIICALLHDVVEDTDYTLKDIEKKYDAQVAAIIDGLTKIPDEIFDVEVKSKQSENFRKVLSTLMSDERVILIKVADRLHNMRTMDSMPEHKQLKIASETLKVYAPLAYRFGYYSIKNELEDLSIKYTNASYYQSIVHKLNLSRKDRNEFINSFIKRIRDSVLDIHYRFKIFAEDKSVFSIINKMKKRKVAFENVDDTFNLKVVVNYEGADEKELCFRIYSKITSVFPPHIFKIRDWISSPKPNGYQALHVTVMSDSGKWVEIQIMTRNMYNISERGYSAYLRLNEHNSEKINQLGTKNWLNRIRDMMDQNDSDALSFIDDFSGFLSTSEIIVFTPKGELRNLPVNSTVLDFAYAIHTDIGNKCIAGMVNYQINAINQRLKSGDQVEILTSPQQKPTEQWYHYVVTARAKTRIKNALRQQKKNLEKEGEQKLLDYFNQLNLVYTDEVLGRLQKDFKLPNKTELLYKIYRGSISFEDVKKCCTEEKERWITNIFKVPKLFGSSNSKKSLSETLFEQIKEKNNLLVAEKMDLSELNYDLAECCLPIPGDEIIGIINPDDEIKIHRTGCVTAINLMSKYGDRIFKTKWNQNESVGFLSGVFIKGLDQQGFIQEVAEIINDEFNLNMHSFNIETDHGIIEGKVMLYVYSVSHLKQLITRLKKHKNIKEVRRVNPDDELI